MRQHIVEIDGSLIRDFKTFHDVFTSLLGFPSYYGRNMDAWIDCMSNPDSDCSLLGFEDGDAITLRVANAEALKAAAPGVYAALVECAAFVNERCDLTGQRPMVKLELA